MKKKNKNKRAGHIQRPYANVNHTPTLSVCMIVKNEEENLPRALGSIQGLADEIIVVDTGSTDRTVEIARTFGAKVYFFEWCDDFSAARNESLRHATCDHILWLDGDDELPKKEHEKIKKDLLIKKDHAFYLHIKNNLQSHENVSIQLRMFPNKRGIRFSGRVHEQVYDAIVDAGIKMSLCHATIIHHGYLNNEDIIKKLKRNEVLLKQELENNPDKANTLLFLARTLKGLNKIDEASHCLDILIERAREGVEFRSTDLFRIVLVEKTSILCLNNRLGDAISLMEEFNAPQGKDNLINFTMAELYYKSGDYENAYRYLERMRSETFEAWLLPINPRVCRRNLNTYLGVSSLFVKDYATARMCFNDLIYDEPDNREYYHYLILCEERAGNIDRAIKICAEASERFEGEASFMKKRLFLLIEKGDINGACNELALIDSIHYDLEVLTGGFLLGCLTLNLNRINHFYELLLKTLLMQYKPFPEDCLKIKGMLEKLGEGKSLSFFERGLNYLVDLPDIQDERSKINPIE